jgi:hypothetical protein
MIHALNLVACFVCLVVGLVVGLAFTALQELVEDLQQRNS